VPRSGASPVLHAEIALKPARDAVRCIADDSSTGFRDPTHIDFHEAAPSSRVRDEAPLDRSRVWTDESVW